MRTFIVVALAASFLAAHAFAAADVRGPVAASAPARFTFPNAEFMPEKEGLQAAQDFVKNELPQGLAMSVAVARVERAHAACRRAIRQTVCTYFIESHPPDGDSGENVWTVRLIPDLKGALQSATVARSHVGL